VEKNKLESQIDMTTAQWISEVTMMAKAPVHDLTGANKLKALELLGKAKGILDDKNTPMGATTITLVDLLDEDLQKNLNSNNEDASPGTEIRIINPYSVKAR
jgi:hypothetical protein